MPRPRIEHLGDIEIDLYAVVAKWLIAYGGSKTPPPATFDDVARALLTAMREGDPEEHRRLLAAAMATTKYVGDQMLAQLQAILDG